MTKRKNRIHSPAFFSFQFKDVYLGVGVSDYPKKIAGVIHYDVYVLDYKDGVFENSYSVGSFALATSGDHIENLKRMASNCYDTYIYNHRND